LFKANFLTGNTKKAVPPLKETRPIC